MTEHHTPYRGRFAPSPTGPLHAGSVSIALASWLEAQRHDGVWLVRMDDLDPPRELPGAADTILRQLDDLGLVPDEPVWYQSRRGKAYEQAVKKLLDEGHAFYCKLSRRQLKDRDNVHPGPSVAVPPGPDLVVRMAVPDEPLRFDDLFQGTQYANLQAEGGAFVLRRRDGLFAYQLACALDEADMGITHVIRGADLLASSFRQRLVLERLGLPLPFHGHLPVLLDRQGAKLAKSSGAEPVDTARPSATLHRALKVLGQAPPGDLTRAPRSEVLGWARAHWRPEVLHGILERDASAFLQD